MLTLCEQFGGIGSLNPQGNSMKKTLFLCPFCRQGADAHRTVNPLGQASPEPIILKVLPSLPQTCFSSFTVSVSPLLPLQPHATLFPFHAFARTRPPLGTHLSLLLIFRTCPNATSSLLLSWHCLLPSPSHLPSQKGSFCRFWCLNSRTDLIVSRL